MNQTARFGQLRTIYGFRIIGSIIGITGPKKQVASAGGVTMLFVCILGR